MGQRRDSKSTGSLRFGYIDLGGLRVGLDFSAFTSFVGYLGDVFNDDVILAGGYRTGLISYTYSGSNGISAILSLEQGNNVDTDKNMAMTAPSMAIRRMLSAASNMLRTGEQSSPLPHTMPAMKMGRQAARQSQHHRPVFGVGDGRL